MVTKSELLMEAEALGIESVSEDDSMDVIRDAIKTVKEGKSLSYVQLQDQSQRLFGVPRSVVVGAMSAGYLSDPSTKAQAEKAIQKFMEHEGGKG